jgi:hypothetical protein
MSPELPDWVKHPTTRHARNYWISPLGLSMAYRLFGSPFRMNLMPGKPCAMIKGIKWQNNNASLIGIPPPLYFNFWHHNSPGLGIAVNIAMFWVEISSHIIMWVLGLVLMEDFPFVSIQRGLFLDAVIETLRRMLLFLDVVFRFVVDREVLPAAEEPLRVFHIRRLISSICLAFLRISSRVQNSGRIFYSSNVSYIQVGKPSNIWRRNE